jgi:hypothetical protein
MDPDRLVTFVTKRIQSNSTCESIMNSFVLKIDVYKIRYMARRRTFAQLVSAAFGNRPRPNARTLSLFLGMHVVHQTGGC